MDSHLRIGGLSHQTGVHVETIRYYERIGLLPRPARSPRGQRVYSYGHVQRLSFIQRSRELGFGLDDVRALLQLVDGASVGCGTAKEITLRHLADTRGKIRSLKRLEHALEAMADACQPGLQRSCPILDALSGKR